jgi:hypothetical protein
MSQRVMHCLYNLVLPEALDLIATHGGFFPFGAYMDREGECHRISATDRGQGAKSEDVWRELQARMSARASAGELLATGFCMDSRIRLPDTEEPTDSIMFRYENSSGEACDIFTPYRLIGNSKVEIDQGVAVPRKTSWIFQSKPHFLRPNA